MSRSNTMVELACGLRDNGCGLEAEQLLQQALQLRQEAFATPIGRAQLGYRAAWLRMVGRLDEARSLEDELAAWAPRA